MTNSTTFRSYACALFEGRTALLFSCALSAFGPTASQTKAQEVQIAERLLRGLLGQLLRPDAHMADHVEGGSPGAGGLRLQGKLRLAAALVRVLKRYSVGARSGGCLVEKLLVGAHSGLFCLLYSLLALFFAAHGYAPGRSCHTTAPPNVLSRHDADAGRHAQSRSTGHEIVVGNAETCPGCPVYGPVSDSPCIIGLCAG